MPQMPTPCHPEQVDQNKTKIKPNLKNPPQLSSGCSEDIRKKNKQNQPKPQNPNPNPTESVIKEQAAVLLYIPEPDKEKRTDPKQN